MQGLIQLWARRLERQGVAGDVLAVLTYLERLEARDDPLPALELFRRKAMILIDDVALDANLSTDEAARATEALVRRGAPGLNFDGRVLAFLQPPRR